MIDETVLPIAESLLNCLREQMVGHCNPPTQICLRTGQSVVLGATINDDECCSGLAWVRVASSYPSELEFPEVDSIPQGGCPPSFLAVVLEMGIARCAPVDNISTLITCDQWTTVSEEVLHDAAAMRAAFCCLSVDNQEKLLGTWTPISTEGRCAGGTMTVTVSVRNCDVC